MAKAAPRTRTTDGSAPEEPARGDRLTAEGRRLRRVYGARGSFLYLPATAADTRPLRAYFASRAERASPWTLLARDANAVSPVEPTPTACLQEDDRGAAQRRDDPERLASRAPPEVAPPLCLGSWTTDPTDPLERAHGSHSDPGPPVAAEDKGNQDFAFHLELKAPDGRPWVLAGVADGVSNATWSSRAARHAAAAFVESVQAGFSEPGFPLTGDLLLGDTWPALVARLVHQHLVARFTNDRDYLLKHRYVDPTWSADLFRTEYWHGTDSAARIRRTWFQTTLLAAALGPEGGFALLLGDGYARIDRCDASGSWDFGAGLDETRMISLGLTEADVRHGLVRLAPRDATQLGILLATDGVSKSSREGIAEALAQVPADLGPATRHALDRAVLQSSHDCATFLSALAAQSPPRVDCDNMSIAFARRRLQPGGKQ